MRRVTAAWLSQRGIRIHRDAELPVGIQLEWAFRAAIICGRLEPGERLPPLRDLAGALAVNPNTVRSVMGSLQRGGFVDARHGSGTFVAAAPPSHAELARLIANAMREARAAGVDPRELAAGVYNAERVAVDEAALQRRRMRNDIATLDRLLGELVADRPELLGELPNRSPRPREARVVTLEELEKERDALLRAVAAVQTAMDRAHEEPSGGPPPASKTARATRRKPKPAPSERHGIQPA